MSGQFVFLNENHYSKDGEYRCYASFADPQGKVLNFNASAVSGNFPPAFTICDLDFDMQVYGKSQALVLNSFSEIDKMVPKSEKGEK